MTSRAASPLKDAISLVAEGPVAVRSLLWRRLSGEEVCTIVAKVTYEISPGECGITTPEPIHEFDIPWDEASSSVRTPADLVPMKVAPEVTLSGSAFSAGGRATQRVTARLAVLSVDKVLEAWAPRQFAPSGELLIGVPRATFPLAFEYAGGGPTTDNPVGPESGVDDDVPSLQPPGLIWRGPTTHVPTMTFAPYASNWPVRQSLLRREDESWLSQPHVLPMPRGFDARFFQVAPLDQRLDEPIPSDCRILLESMHPDLERLVMNLPGFEPFVVLFDPQDKVSRMRADSLHIDTDRRLITLTWRHELPHVAGTSVRSVVTLRRSADTLYFSDLKKLREHHMLRAESRRGADPFEQTRSEMLLEAQPSPALPFADAPPSGVVPRVIPPAPKSHAHPPGVLPFGGAPRTSPPPAPRRTRTVVPIEESSTGSLPAQALGIAEPDTETPIQGETAEAPAFVAAVKPQLEGLSKPLAPSAEPALVPAPPAQQAPPMVPPMAPPMAPPPMISGLGGQLGGQLGSTAPRLRPPSVAPPPAIAPPAALAPASAAIPSAPPPAVPAQSSLASTAISPGAPLAPPPVSSQLSGLAKPQPAVPVLSPPPPTLVPPDASKKKDASDAFSKAFGGPSSSGSRRGSEVPPAAVPPPPAPVVPANVSPRAPAAVTPRFEAAPMPPPPPPPVSTPSYLFGAASAAAIAAATSPPAAAPPAPPPPATSFSSAGSSTLGGPSGPSSLSGTTLGSQSLGGSKDAGRSAKDLSDDAALASRPAAGRARADDNEGPAKRAVVDLLYYQQEIVARLDRDPYWREKTAQASLGLRRTADAAREKDPDQERLRLLKLLCTVEPIMSGELRYAYEDRLAASSIYELPLILAEGDLEPAFDEVETLKLMLAATSPLGVNDKKLGGLVKVANEMLASSWPPTGESALGLARQLEQAAKELALPPRYLTQQVDRALLEARHFKKRSVFGGTHLRADFIIPRADGHLPLYVDENVIPKLPLLGSIRVIALGELRPQEDSAESHPDAFVALALARRVDVRKR
ncbi:MAG: DUF2169 domain-containing protein [Polyangiaceae bacterium]|nr:DUF2169 domain-containing protein [Polyangiaceae bacterium]